MAAEKSFPMRIFPFDECCRLLDFARKEKAGLIFKFPRHMYIYQHPEKVDWLQGQMNSDIGSEPFIFHPEQDRHFLELPQCASIHADPDRVREFARASTLSFRQFSAFGFDVAPQGVNKGSGIRKLLTILDLPKDKCACFGDNYNDIEMMEGMRLSHRDGQCCSKDQGNGRSCDRCHRQRRHPAGSQAPWGHLKRMRICASLIKQNHTSEAVPPLRSAFFLRLPAP